LLEERNTRREEPFVIERAARITPTAVARHRLDLLLDLKQR